MVGIEEVRNVSEWEKGWQFYDSVRTTEVLAVIQGDEMRIAGTFSVENFPWIHPYTSPDTVAINQSIVDVHVQLKLVKDRGLAEYRYVHFVPGGGVNRTLKRMPVNQWLPTTLVRGY